MVDEESESAVFISAEAETKYDEIRSIHVYSVEPGVLKVRDCGNRIHGI